MAMVVKEVGGGVWGVRLHCLMGRKRGRCAASLVTEHMRAVRQFNLATAGRAGEGEFVRTAGDQCHLGRQIGKRHVARATAGAMRLVAVEAEVGRGGAMADNAIAECHSSACRFDVRHIGGEESRSYYRI